MFTFLAIFPAEHEHRVAVTTSQGRKSESAALEVWVTGGPWWPNLPGTLAGPACTDEGLVAAVRGAYRVHGTGLFAAARGHFSLALVDHATQRVMLGIDRSGVGTLAFARTASGQLIFGTSSLGVATHPAVGAGLSRQALFDYLYFHTVPSPGTVYQGVDKLRPGHFLLHERGRSTLERYWQPRFATATDAPSAVLQKNLQTALRASVSRAVNRGRWARSSAGSGQFLRGGHAGGGAPHPPPHIFHGLCGGGLQRT